MDTIGTRPSYHGMIWMDMSENGVYGYTPKIAVKQWGALGLFSHQVFWAGPYVLIAGSSRETILIFHMKKHTLDPWKGVWMCIATGKYMSHLAESELVLLRIFEKELLP